MRSEQWIRTQKRRVRKKYKKAGSVYFSPKEIRDLKHGKNLSALTKAVKNIAKAFQELAATISETVKAMSEAYKETESE